MNFPTLSIVCAMAQNRVIGRDNKLPWHLPADLAYFKNLTLGHPIIMGRKTFESIGRPLPQRTNIVVTAQAGWSAAGVTVVNSLEEALTAANQAALAMGVQEMMLIGGATLYEQALPLAHRLYLTEVQAEIEGDAFFPQWNRSQWMEKSRQPHSADHHNCFAYEFAVYERKEINTQKKEI
jgi:dihydrofolate reductase